MRIDAIWRYPVKSLRGEQVATVEVGQHGLVGDRAYGLVDQETGNVLTARREPRLLFASARWRDGEVEITGPDGSRLATDAALSAWLERPVRLARAGEQGGTYENPQDAERETGWAAWQGPGYAWHDSGDVRVSLMSTGTLAGWAPERFRSNLLLDGAGEDALVGHRVLAGTATLAVRGRVSRCVMVTRAQPGIEVDRDVLRTIHRERGGELAVGAVVVAPGRIAAGQQLELLP